MLKYSSPTCSLNTCLLVTWSQLFRAHMEKGTDLTLSRILWATIVYIVQEAWDLQTEKPNFSVLMSSVRKQSYT